MIRLKTNRLLVLFVLPLLLSCGRGDRSKSRAANEVKGEPPPVLQHVLPISTSSSTAVATRDDVSNSRRNAITRAVEKLKPAVVGINVTQIREYVPKSLSDDFFFRFFYPEYRYRQKVKSLGSGFLISPDGYIVTNEHVVHGAVEILVTMITGDKYNARLIGSDYKTDVALLKIDGENFPYCELGNSDDVIIGEWVIALGNPFGLFEVGNQPSVTVGVVSSKNLDFGIQEDERLYQGMIQTDAAINPGNSGGPMANALGQVIGVNTFIFTGSETNRGSIGLGFASPINRVKEIVAQLIKFGKVDRQWWTGLEVETLRPSVARYLGLRNRAGVIITNVESDSPAEKAGLKTYDIIIELNGHSVNSTQDIWNVLETMDARAGDVIPLKFIRKGKIYRTEITLGKVSE